MACEPFQRMEQEELFIEALHRSVRYHRQKGEQLELRAEDGSPTLILLQDAS
jgi:heat shock protein HslJ